ncbi:hypothetical protein SAMN04488082_1271, partial [Desulfomicrobium apsheronum]
MAESQNSRQNVQAPQAGQTVIVNAIPGQDIVLEAAFDQAEVILNNGNVIFEFEGGGQVVLNFADLGTAQAPNVVMPDGTILNMEEFLASLGESEVEPAAGPEGGAEGSGGVGQYRDDAGNLIDGVDKLGGLDPREFTSISIEALEADPLEEEESVLNSPPTISASGGIVNEAGLENGTIAESNAEFLPGSFTISDPDGLGDITSLSINGVVIPIGSLVGSVVPTSLGVLTITGFDAGTGVVSYLYQLAAPQDHSDGDVSDFFPVTVTDAAGASASATVTISVLDDEPSVSNVVVADSVVLDETDAGEAFVGGPIIATSEAAIISAALLFGADDAAATDSEVYGLTLSGDGTTLLKTAQGDFAITLVETGDQTIEGQY